MGLHIAYFVTLLIIINFEFVHTTSIFCVLGH
jgi:hypothetical protein